MGTQTNLYLNVERHLLIVVTLLAIKQRSERNI